MLRFLFDDLFGENSSWSIRILALVGIFLLILCVALLFILGYVLIDSVGITTIDSTLTIVEMKEVHPAYTTLMPVGKVMIPQYHSESYSIYFTIADELVSADVNESFFNMIDSGDKIKVLYGFGRISGDFYATDIEAVGN